MNPRTMFRLRRVNLPFSHARRNHVCRHPFNNRSGSFNGNNRTTHAYTTTSHANRTLLRALCRTGLGTNAMFLGRCCNISLIGGRSNTFINVVIVYVRANRASCIHTGTAMLTANNTNHVCSSAAGTLVGANSNINVTLHTNIPMRSVRV